MSKVQILVTGALNVEVAKPENFAELQSLAKKFASGVKTDTTVAALKLSTSAGQAANAHVSADRKGLKKALANAVLAVTVIAATEGIELEEVLDELTGKVKRDLGAAASAAVQGELISRGLLKVA